MSVTFSGEGARPMGISDEQVLEVVLQAMRATNQARDAASQIVVSADATQAEIDDLWEKLSAGGEKRRCGWLKDKFGVSWQVVPSELGQLMHGGDPERTRRVVTALMQMEKLDIGKLRQAYGA